MQMRSSRSAARMLGRATSSSTRASMCPGSAAPMHAVKVREVNLLHLMHRTISRTGSHWSTKCSGHSAREPRSTRDARLLHSSNSGEEAASPIAAHRGAQNRTGPTNCTNGRRSPRGTRSRPVPDST